MRRSRKVHLFQPTHEGTGTWGGVVVKLHAFLTSALDEDEWSASL